MKQKLIWTLVLLICVILIAAGVRNVDALNIENSDTIVLRSVDRVNIDDIYDSDYQQSVKEEIETYKTQQEYTLEHPLVIENPFETNTTSLYLYFTSEEASSLTYNVHVDNTEIPDFSRTLYNGEENNVSTTHEYQLIGLIPDSDNEITLTLKDKNGETIQTSSFSYHAPELLGEEDIILEKNKGESSEEVSNGLYTIMGNDSDQQDFIYLYDNNGVIRSEIPIVEYRSHRLIYDDEGYMYTSVSETQIAKFDRLGQVVELYDMGSYLLHHDYVFQNEDTMMILASIADSDTQEDCVISLDIDTGEVSLVIDFNNLMKAYKKQVTLPKDADTLDWLHFNTIVMAEDENSILLSSRETSTIMKINNLNTAPTLEYFIAEPSIWESTGYESLLLEKEGEFTAQTGQHSITYVQDDQLSEGQYYLYMFNNNSAISTTRPDYDWSLLDGVSTSSKKGTSKFYKYLVDEHKGTYTLVESFDLPYSAYVSSVQEIEDNIVVNSGQKFMIGEYDSEGKLIQSFNVSGEKFIYRCYKYTYHNFWFYE